MIDDKGEMLGIVPTSAAMAMAKEKGLDLVEVSPNTNPPVCKFLDYGKYRFELQKKQADAKKKQKSQGLKEIQFRPTIGKHDLEIKKRALKRFLEEGHKVRLIVQFRGREISHPEVGINLLLGIEKELQETAQFTINNKLEGKKITAIVSGRNNK